MACYLLFFCCFLFAFNFTRSDSTFLYQLLERTISVPKLYNFDTLNSVHHKRAGERVAGDVASIWEFDFYPHIVHGISGVIYDLYRFPIARVPKNEYVYEHVFYIISRINKTTKVFNTSVIYGSIPSSALEAKFVEIYYI